MKHSPNDRAGYKFAAQRAKHAEQEWKVCKDEYWRIGWRIPWCRLRLLVEGKGDRGSDGEDEIDLCACL